MGDVYAASLLSLMKELLESSATIVAALSTLIVALSVSHEYGYFMMVGSQFQAFVTTSDYLSNAIFWLPVTIIFSYVYLDWRGILAPLVPKKEDWKTWIGPVLFILGFPIFWVFYGSPSFPVVLLAPAIYLWAILFNRWMAKYKESGERVISLLRIVQFGVPVAAFTFTMGVMDGNNDLQRSTDPYIIQIKDNDQPISRIILRNFERGILVREPPKTRVEFLKWENITSVARISEPMRNDPLSCGWFKIGCFK